MTKSTKPIIKSITPSVIKGGNQMPKKELLPLHYHPKAIVESVKKFKEDSDVKELKFFFEDVETILEWAFKRLPIAVPQKEEDNPNE